jgi:hypothetical protein
MEPVRDGARREPRGPLVVPRGGEEGAIPSEEVTEAEEEAIEGVATAASTGEERGEWCSSARTAGVESISATSGPSPPLAMLPVSTIMELTDMAPGVRAPEGRAREEGATSMGSSTMEEVEAEGEGMGVASATGVAALSSTTGWTASGSTVDASLLELPSLLDPAEPDSLALFVVGELRPLLLALLGLTTLSGTAALPPPRLATLCCPPSRSLLPPPLARGLAGANPKEPPSGKRGFASAPTFS